MILFDSQINCIIITKVLRNQHYDNTHRRLEEKNTFEIDHYIMSHRHGEDACIDASDKLLKIKSSKIVGNGKFEPNTVSKK